MAAPLPVETDTVSPDDATEAVTDTLARLVIGRVGLTVPT
jgi:hypothetical protein